MDSQRVTLCLVHDGVQPGNPVPEPVRFGLQDAKREVHPGSPAIGAGHRRRFEVPLTARNDGEKGPRVFSGSSCHGPPKSRFLYLSWKREDVHAAPWAWRIKVPLAGISWPMIRDAAGPDLCIEADVTGCRPHATEPILWRVVPRRSDTIARDGRCSSFHPG